MGVRESNKGYHKGNDSITNSESPNMLLLKNRFQCFPILQFSTEALAKNREGLAYLNFLKLHIAPFE
jgi:hypothetical protein